MEKKDEEPIYAGVYNELYQLFDEATVLIHWKYFRGTSVNFPQKLYDQAYVKKYIKEHMNDIPASRLATKLGLSERRIRQIIKEINNEETR